MDHGFILSRVEHTLLRPDSTWDEVKSVIDDGITYGVATVCIPPSFVRQAAQYAAGRVPICTVIGFPNGYSTTAVKAFEAADAVKNGADEIDMVVNIGWVKSQLWDDIAGEISKIKTACEGRPLKVIIEACLLSDDEKRQLCRVACDAGADYVKTSTGFSTGGATFEDVRLMRESVGDRAGIKAAGGIRTLEDAEKFIECGADRLGTSSVLSLIKALGK
ncbi:MAG: deoxyribose-phosphate aldolase [Oscillospiraceae bacterium]|nr:deoxyribose-phosphate aldolase [Oscillospiraceae bacterium]